MSGPDLTDRELDLAARWGLTPLEARLLAAIEARAPRPASVRWLIARLYPAGEEPSRKLIHVVVCHVRRKAPEIGIKNTYGQGYRLLAPLPEIAPCENAGGPADG